MSSDKFFALFGKIILVLVLLIGVSVAAFYFGTKSQQKQTSNLKSNNQPSTSPSAMLTSTPTPTVDEASLLKVVIKNALVAKHGDNANSLNITVLKIEGDYASGGASAQDGGGMWLAAKANGVWNLVWDGNGTIQCSSFINYPNFPTSLAPECWDDKTQAVVKR